MNHLNIRRIRIEKGWKQTYVAEKTGITKQSVYAIETGQMKPSYDVLIKLCKLFNVPHTEVEELFAAADNEKDNFC